MPDVHLTLKDGKSVALAMPEPGEGRSAFLLSLPKAGSTLFYRMMTPICTRAGLPYYSMPNELNGIGVPIAEVREGFERMFQPTGYVYGGFRGFERTMALPDYADGRTVLLVRDPRDMLTSLYFSESKSHVPPGTSASDVLLKQFEERRQRALAMSIDEFAIQRSAGVLAAYEGIVDAIGDRAHRLFRYEDVIFEKQRWMEEVVDYLGLTVAPNVIRNVVEKNDIRPSVEDDGQHIRKVAPGDHLDKLKPATIARLDEVFAEIMQRYGYGAAAAPSPMPPVPPPPAGESTNAREQRIARVREERRAARVAERIAERKGAKKPE